MGVFSFVKLKAKNIFSEGISLQKGSAIHECLLQILREDYRAAFHDCLKSLQICIFGKGSNILKVYNKNIFYLKLHFRNPTSLINVLYL